MGLKAEPQTIWAYLPILVVLSVFLVSDLAIATIVNAQGEEAGATVVGFVFSQVALYATWTALGPISLFARTAGGVIATSLVALALVLCIRNSGVGHFELLWFGITMTQWVGIQLPLWVLRLYFGWRLAWPGTDLAPARPTDLQFGIRQLMMWTALVAVTLGVGRWLLTDELRNNGRDESIVVFLVLTSFNCLLAWPIIWALLIRFAWPLWLVAAGVCCVMLTLTEIATMKAVIGRGGGWEFFWIMNAIQSVSGAAALLGLRLSGFRLARSSDRVGPKG